MLIIKVDNQNIEQALKTLKRKTFAVKQLKELREREEYVKPSVTKRSEKSKAKYRQSFQEE
jgi:small subunit ribosomal protein S21